LLFTCTESRAQTEGFTSQPTKRNEYALVVYGGSGPGYYFSVSGVPDYLQPKVQKISPVSTIRLMWHPDHLIKVGLETGFMTFVSYKLKDSLGKDGKIRLNAIPVLIEWTMALTKRFNVFAGSGVYFLNTQLDYAGRSRSSKLSIGWMAAMSYIHPLSKDVGLGAEAKWLDAAESTDGSICLQLQLVWKFLKW
jgi:hypothetical protein